MPASIVWRTNTHGKHTQARHTRRHRVTWKADAGHAHTKGVFRDNGPGNGTGCFAVAVTCLDCYNFAKNQIIFSCLVQSPQVCTRAGRVHICLVLWKKDSNGASPPCLPLVAQPRCPTSATLVPRHRPTTCVFDHYKPWLQAFRWCSAVWVRTQAGRYTMGNLSPVVITLLLVPSAVVSAVQLPFNLALLFHC